MTSRIPPSTQDSPLAQEHLSLSSEPLAPGAALPIDDHGARTPRPRSPSLELGAERALKKPRLDDTALQSGANRRVNALPVAEQVKAALFNAPYAYIPFALHDPIFEYVARHASSAVSPEPVISDALASLGLPPLIRPNAQLSLTQQKRWWHGFAVLRAHSQGTLSAASGIEALQHHATARIDDALAPKEILPGALATFFPWSDQEREDLKAVHQFASTLPNEHDTGFALARLFLSLIEAPYSFADVVATMPAQPRLEGPRAAEANAMRFHDFLPLIPYVNDPGEDFSRILAEGHLTRIWHIGHDDAVNFLFHYAVSKHRPKLLAALIACDPYKNVISIEERPQLIAYTQAIGVLHQETAFCEQLTLKYGAQNVALFLSQAADIARMLEAFLPRPIQAPAA